MKIQNSPNPCSSGLKRLVLAATAGAALLAGNASADTTIAASGSFTINDGNTTKVGTVTTWNDTGTLTINNGGALQSWPSQNQSMINNDAIVFAGAGGTYKLYFNDNDTDFMMNGATITSTATGAQTLDVRTGYNGNGDRESVTFNAGIPNVGDGSALSLNATFKVQSGGPNWVNLPAVNTFTGPISLIQGNGAQGYLTIGGTLTRYSGTTYTAGTLNSGNYAGNIALDTSTTLNYASSADQI